MIDMQGLIDWAMDDLIRDAMRWPDRAVSDTNLSVTVCAAPLPLYAAGAWIGATIARQLRGNLFSCKYRHETMIQSRTAQTIRTTVR